jgi:hypothetical protein
MEYSFVPFVADTFVVKEFFFLWLFFSVCLLLLVSVVQCMELDCTFEKAVCSKTNFGVQLILLFLFVFACMTQEVDHPPKNVELVGTLVSIDGYAKTGTKGKISNEIFVKYKVEDKIIPFIACAGCAYPEKATIYRKY